MPCEICDATERVSTYTCSNPKCEDVDHQLCIKHKRNPCPACKQQVKWVFKVDIEKEEESSKKSRKRVRSVEGCDKKPKVVRTVKTIPDDVLNQLKLNPQKYADDRAEELSKSDDLTGQETLCITVLKKGEEYKVLMTYSFGEYGYSGYADSAKDYEVFQDPPDPIRHDVRNVTKPNSFYLREVTGDGAKDFKVEDQYMTGGGKEVQKFNKAVAHAEALSKKTGKKYVVDGPYQAYVATTDPGGRNDNHAEMRAITYAKNNGYEVVAMAPTHPCCPHCYNKMCTTRNGVAVADDGARDIDKVPPERRVKRTSMPANAKKLYKVRDQDKREEQAEQMQEDEEFQKDEEEEESGGEEQDEELEEDEESNE